MIVHLVRHGETASNAARIFQLPDTPLSDVGRRQAERLARRLAAGRVGRIVASDLARAETTARAVAEATGAPLGLTPLLQERNFGDLRGTPYAALETDPFAPDYAPPGGETWEVFHARVDRAWRHVLTAVESHRVSGAGGDLVVVTHGLVCASVVQRLVTLPEELAAGEEHPALRFRNTSITSLRGPRQWVVEVLGCVAHLEDRADPEADGGKHAMGL